MTSKMQYPEHEKLHAVKDKSQKIGEFLDWCREEKGWCLCQAAEGSEWVDYVPVGKRTEEILAEFFEIDLNVLENEKRKMLEIQRKLNDGKHGVCFHCGEAFLKEELKYYPASDWSSDLQEAMTLDDSPDRPLCPTCRKELNADAE